jgi:hypothetical protein
MTAKTAAPAETVKQDAAGKSGEKKKSGGFGFKLALAALAAGALSVIPLCLIALPGLMPSIAVFFADRGRPRYTSYTVAVMNFAGVFPFLLTALKHGLSLEASAAKLSDPFTWLVMYGAAALGWLTCALTPAIARFCLEIQAMQRRRTLESMAKAIVTEWGDEVAKGKR